MNSDRVFDNDYTMVLTDGRVLGYRLSGDPQGKPFFTFHGLPGSRMEGMLFDEAAKRLGVKIITPDRPGYGLSTYQPERSLVEWGRDVVQLADILGLDTFGIIGISGGAPCALSCAYTIPKRIKTIGIICGLGPVYQPQLLKDMRFTIRLGFSMARRTPRLLSFLYGLPVYCVAKTSPSLTLFAVALQNGGIDRKVLADHTNHQKMLLITREAFRQGVKGALKDMALYMRDWGFPLEAIKHKVMIWHGDQDKIVPLSHGHYYHAHLPGAMLNVIAGEAHFSLPIRQAENILQQLLEQ